MREVAAAVWLAASVLAGSGILATFPPVWGLVS